MISLTCGILNLKIPDLTNTDEGVGVGKMHEGEAMKGYKFSVIK